MKGNLRFVDSDMHVIEPPDLFEKYLDPKFKDRVTSPLGADGKPRRERPLRGNLSIDGEPRSMDEVLEQYRKPMKPVGGKTNWLLSGSRSFAANRYEFAITRDYDAKAQVMAMQMEGIDIAVLFPSMGLGLLARDELDPLLSNALCQAYNNWMHDFCEYSPDQLKFAAMLPLHDVNLACRELLRCVKDLGAVSSFIRPNIINGRFWHSNYWNPLYRLHEELNVTWPSTKDWERGTRI